MDFSNKVRIEKIICYEIDRYVSWNDTSIGQCDKFFQSFNRCFTIFAHSNHLGEDVSETKKFKFFLKNFISDENVEKLILHPVMKSLSVFNPLIQDDRIVSNALGDIALMNPEMGSGLYESAVSLHKQFVIFTIK